MIVFLLKKSLISHPPKKKKDFFPVLSFFFLYMKSLGQISWIRPHQTNPLPLHTPNNISFLFSLFLSLFFPLYMNGPKANF